MDDSLFPPGLTPALAQEIFPIARSDRRAHKDLFLAFLDEGQIKDDPAFYEALVHMITGGGIAQLRRYDDRMQREGAARKQFGLRALRWLMARTGDGLSLLQIGQLPADHFLLGSPEAAVLGFYHALAHDHRTPTDPAPDSTVPDGQPDWQSLAAEIARMAGSMDAPDAALADRIVATAQNLRDACDGAARKLARAEEHRRQAEALRARLETVDPHLAAGLAPELDPDLAKDLDAAIGTVEQAMSVHLAEQQTLSDLVTQTQAALAAGDFTGAAHCAALAATAKERVAVAEADETAARQVLAGRLVDPGKGAYARATLTETDRPDDSGAPEASDPDPAPEPPLPDGGAARSCVQPDQDLPSVATEPDPTPVPAVDPDPAGSPPVVAPPSGQIERTPSDMVDIVAGYLGRGEIVLAWHLSRLIEDPPLAPPLLRALAILRGVSRSEDMADPRRTEAMAEITAALALAGDSAAAARVALAALLRPALLDPDNGARSLVANLRGLPGLAPYVGVADSLSALGHEVRLSAQMLSDIAGTRPPPAAPKARADLDAWWRDARRRKTKHQPTYSILHRELHPEGEVGAVIAAALAEGVAAAGRVRSFVTRLRHDRTAQEQFVAAAEARSGRPKQDRIENDALDWFCARLQEACDHLADWLDACTADEAAPQDVNRERLLRAIGGLRKAIDQCATPADTVALDAAAARVLDDGLADLRRLLDGQAGSVSSSDLHHLLSDPLLRLPGGCQDWTDGDATAFAQEVAAADRRRLAALMLPDTLVAGIDTALSRRVDEHAILAAERLLELQSDRGDARLAELRQDLAEKTAAARSSAIARTERLRQSLTTLGFLDAETMAELPGDIARLSAILTALTVTGDEEISLPATHRSRVPEVPPDFPELADVLTEVEARRDRLRTLIAMRQRAALERLASGRVTGSATSLLAAFDRLDPVTVDDAIAELNAGRDVPVPEAERDDALTRFFPGFTSRVDAAAATLTRGRILQAARDADAVGPLDFASMEPGRRRRLEQIIECWGAAENAMKQSQPVRLRESLAQVFGFMGFTGFRIADGREAVPGRVRSLVMDCDVPRPAGWFLPPSFGSVTGGRYRLLAVRAETSIDQLLRLLGAEAPDAAWIVIVFGRLGVSDRRRLARQTRAEARQALVLDETMLLFAATDADDPLATFLTCALPFSWVQPYTTSPGQIPPEVFFGRRAEIDRILARDGGGCLIYGGRQLGKSALLNHIRAERHRPDIGELAIYLDIKPIGGVQIAADRIWQELAFELQRNGLMQLSAEPNLLVTGVQDWLRADPSRRVIAMFDEADNLLQAEHAAGYPNLQKLKNLMEATGQRFKAVFAGLHNVRRMAQAPNSPLPHLGEPICIGPMNMTPENRAALRRLAVDPIRAAGLDYVDPGLVSDMLARMNYYPSLVQVFGRQIVESVGRRPPVDGEGPRWPLGRDSMFEGETAARIAHQIREKFQLTLNLDLRYECIAKSLALHRIETTGGDTQVLSQGLSSTDIWNLLLWPRSLGKPSMGDFEELLKEMVDLGVLGAFPQNRYGLRNAQVAQMLGNRDVLTDDLLRLDEREAEPAYDAATFHRLLRMRQPASRAPLPDRLMDRLFDRHAPGLRILEARPGIAGPDVAGRLLDAARTWMNGDHASVAAEDTRLRKALDAVRSDSAILVIEGAWSPATAELLARNPKVAAGQVLPIWCLASLPEPAPAAQIYRSLAWQDAMVRHWLADEGLAPGLDDAESRLALLRASGGAPARLAALRPVLGELVALPAAGRAAQLARWTTLNPLPAAVLALSADDQTCLAALREFEELEPSYDDLVASCSAMTRDRLRRLAASGLVELGRRDDDAPALTHLGRLAAG